MKPLLLALALTSVAPAQQCRPFDTIFVNGSILTGNALTSSEPERITALGINNGLITLAGTDAQVLAYCSHGPKPVDLHGAFVMPGFNDAHTHMASAGQQKLTVDLDGAASLAEMQARIRAYTATSAPGQWILGSGWDHTRWPSRTLPTRQDLDQVTAGHPAVFYRTDGHIVVANSAALLAAGISPSTPDPVGGKIDRDPAGNPTGIVRETPAVALIYAKVPPPTPEARRKALDLAIADALAHGVTSIQDFSEWQDWLILESMEHRNQLNLRVSEWLDFNLPLPVLKERRASHDPNDPLLHIGFLKAFMDGSLGSRTAALAEPYADDPSNSGIPRYDQQKLNQLSTERAAAGFQLGFHAIGDEANAMALNAFAAAEQVAVPAPDPSEEQRRRQSVESCLAQHPEARQIADSCGQLPLPLPSPRHRIEHAQVLLPEDFDRMAHEGVIASMQPSHLLTDMAWAESRLGRERAKYAYAWRSMLDHGIPLAFGTDYPVESINPFRGLYSAVTRQNEAGTQTFHPEQRLTIRQAIYAYTQASAFAEFRETRVGRLQPGFLADFIILDRDLLTAAPTEILHTKVLRTVVGGKTVYTAP